MCAHGTVCETRAPAIHNWQNLHSNIRSRTRMIAGTFLRMFSWKFIPGRPDSANFIFQLLSRVCLKTDSNTLSQFFPALQQNRGPVPAPAALKAHRRTEKHPFFQRKASGRPDLLQRGFRWRQWLLNLFFSPLHELLIFPAAFLPPPYNTPAADSAVPAIAYFRHNIMLNTAANFSGLRISGKRSKAALFTFP